MSPVSLCYVADLFGSHTRTACFGEIVLIFLLFFFFPLNPMHRFQVLPPQIHNSVSAAAAKTPMPPHMGGALGQSSAATSTLAPPASTAAAPTSPARRQLPSLPQSEASAYDPLTVPSEITYDEVSTVLDQVAALAVSANGGSNKAKTPSHQDTDSDSSEEETVHPKPVYAEVRKRTVVPSSLSAVSAAATSVPVATAAMAAAASSAAANHTSTAASSTITTGLVGAAHKPAGLAAPVRQLPQQVGGAPIAGKPLWRATKKKGFWSQLTAMPSLFSSTCPDLSFSIISRAISRNSGGRCQRLRAPPERGSRVCHTASFHQRCQR